MSIELGTIESIIAAALIHNPTGVALRVIETRNPKDDTQTTYSIEVTPKNEKEDGRIRTYLTMTSTREPVLYRRDNFDPAVTEIRKTVLGKDSVSLLDFKADYHKIMEYLLEEGKYVNDGKGTTNEGVVFLYATVARLGMQLENSGVAVQSLSGKPYDANLWGSLYNSLNPAIDRPQTKLITHPPVDIYGGKTAENTGFRNVRSA
ncbi:hypothetical protein HZB01_02505 [Candidatus Woesearchaeota archaeon]|nr:hypothetical protein [Candidatus Woesearchaeota archaeon]